MSPAPGKRLPCPEVAAAGSQPPTAGLSQGLHYQSYDCKERGLPTDGAMLVFSRLMRAALETDGNLVVTTDHSGGWRCRSSRC